MLYNVDQVEDIKSVLLTTTWRMIIGRDVLMKLMAPRYTQESSLLHVAGGSSDRSSMTAFSGTERKSFGKTGIQYRTLEMGM